MALSEYEGRFVSRQKAPSAIRCIKTALPYGAAFAADEGQKAPSAIRCIKPSQIEPVAGAQ